MVRRYAAAVSPRSALVRDATIAVVLAATAFVPPLATHGTRLGELPHRPIDALAVAAALAQSLPLAMRRPRPAITLAVAAAGFAVQELRGYASFASVGLLVAVYSAGAYQVRFRRWTGLLASAAFVALALGLHRAGSTNRVADYAAFYIALAGGWFLGTYVRVMRSTAALRRRVEADAARADERARIARELHDVVTHHVTAMVVQANAAQFLPLEPARESLTAIKETGKQALGDLRDLLGVLDPPPHGPAPRGPASQGVAPQSPAPRDPARRGPVPLGPEPLGPEPLGTEPLGTEPLGTEPLGSALLGPGHEAPRDRLPGLTALPELIERTRAAGQPVALLEEGSPPTSLGTGRELTTYRVVQESLTNALKYAAGRPTAVRLRYRPAGIDISVTTAPPTGHSAPSASPGGSGRGLTGLRERLELFGGSLSAGPADDGGFAVTAHLPTGDGS
jgi:signal transduction histidine kinase